MASSGVPREGWVTKAKGILWSSPRKDERRLVAEWQQRQLPVQLFGVARHAERADGIYAFWKGQRWTSTDDYVQWPLDPPLSDEGMESAQELGDRVRRFATEQATAVRVVISSPYFRCVQTAVMICKALGRSARLLIDWSLGEVYGPSVMGEQEPVNPVRGMDAALAFCRAQGVSCDTRIIGKWPCWPETLQDARRRYAHRFLSFLQKSDVTRRNFVLVAHADSVGAVLSTMPSQLDRSVEKVEYGGMLLAKRRKPKAAVQGVHLSSVMPMATAPEDSDPDESTPQGTLSDLEESGAAKPGVIHSTWTTEDDASCMWPPSGKPGPLSPPPPKASDGWEVDLYDITTRRRKVAAKFQKRVQDLAKQSLFSQDRIEQLLGGLGDKPLSGKEADPNPRTLAFETLSSSFSGSTYVFGYGDDLNTECSEVQSNGPRSSESEEPMPREQLSSTGSLISGLSSFSQKRSPRHVSISHRRQPLNRNRHQKAHSAQGCTKHERREEATASGQLWSKGIVEQVEMANARASRAAAPGSAATPGSARQLPWGEWRCQPPSVVDDELPAGTCLQQVSTSSAAAVPTEDGLNAPAAKAMLGAKASEQLPAGDLKPVALRSLGASSLMQRRLNAKARTRS